MTNSTTIDESRKMPGQFLGNLTKSQRWLVSILILLAAMAPMLYWHLNQILAKPHYQFAIFVPLGTSLLWRRSLFGENRFSSGAFLSSVVCLVLALLLTLAAVLIWSPTLAISGVLLCILSLTYSYLGWRGVQRAFSGWLLLWLILPLPFGIDEELIEGLRTFSTGWASRILEWMEIRHLTDGNVIKTPSKEFFVADACTGIYSLFVIFAFALFSSIWNNRYWHQSVTLLVASFGIVIVENLVRLTSVVVAWEYQFDLTIDWRHKIFGAFVFCCSLGLVWSADCLIATLLPFRVKLNWGREGSFAEPERLDSKPRNPIIGVAMIWIVLIASLVLLVAQFRTAPTLPNLVKNFSNPWEKLPSFGEQALPTLLNNFSREEFRFEERSGDFPFGKFGQVWAFKNGDRTCEVSLNYPYLGLKDLCKCYEQTGWKIRSVARREEVGDKKVSPFTLATIDKPFAGFGLVMFSDIDETGAVNTKTVTRENKSFSERISDRFASFWSSNKFEDIELKPTAQIQILIISPTEISEAETKELEFFFLEVREKLIVTTSEKLKEIK